MQRGIIELEELIKNRVSIVSGNNVEKTIEELNWFINEWQLNCEYEGVKVNYHVKDHEVNKKRVLRRFKDRKRENELGRLTLDSMRSVEATASIKIKEDGWYERK